MAFHLLDYEADDSHHTKNVGTQICGPQTCVLRFFYLSLHPNRNYVQRLAWNVLSNISRIKTTLQDKDKFYGEPR